MLFPTIDHVNVEIKIVLLKADHEETEENLTNFIESRLEVFFLIHILKLMNYSIAKIFQKV